MHHPYSFNLVDEPWIPCILPGERTLEFLSLRDALERAHEIEEIADPSPLVTITLHRLLLAVLHRCFGPRNAREWARLWERGAWDQTVLEEYFGNWRPRFDLFDERHPFYQTLGLEPEYAGTVAKLTHEIASPANSVMLFDHTIEGSATFSPAQAARYLLACQSFSVGGLVTLRRTEDRSTHKSADASPLTKGAVILVKGNNLFHTLMLNLHQYSPEDQEPFSAEPDDVPAWERDEETQAEDRHPKGYLDLLTWQSRRVRLYPEMDTGGQLTVRRVTIMKGFQFPQVDERRGKETMLAFQRNEKAPAGQDPWPAVSFQEGRDVWRDSLALFQSVRERQERPKMLTWLHALAFDEGVIEPSAIFPLELFGLSTDRAKVLFWRHERLPLPLAYLNNEDLVDGLRRALDFTERVAGLLRGAVRRLAELSLAPESDLGGRSAHGKDVTNLVTALGAERRYWSRLETPFKELLIDLERDQHVENPNYPDQIAYGVSVLPAWADTVIAAARRSLEDVTRSFDTSARTLKAAAVAERQFWSQIRTERHKSGLVRQEAAVGGRV
jgi:CRISPR system Cascade subunit CasA